MLPTSEKGTCLSEGRITQYLLGITSLASVICVKYTMTIITLNKERFLCSLGKRSSSTPFHVVQASPLQSEFPTWVRGLPWDTGRESWEQQSSLCHRPQHQGPTSNTSQRAQLQAPLPTSGPRPQLLPPSLILGLPQILPSTGPCPLTQVGNWDSRPVWVDGNPHGKMSGKHILPSTLQLRPWED